MSIRSHLTGPISIDIRFVAIVDGRYLPGEGFIPAFPQITLDKVFYVSSVNLLSISVITKILYCFVTFFPFHCIF